MKYLLTPTNPAAHSGVSDEEWQRAFLEARAYNDRMLARLLAPGYDPASFDVDHEVRVLLDEIRSSQIGSTA